MYIAILWSNIQDLACLADPSPWPHGRPDRARVAAERTSADGRSRNGDKIIGKDILELISLIIVKYC